MVFSPLHWIPSTLSALIVLCFAVTHNRRQHKALGAAAILLALLGLAGYISAESFHFFPIDLHTFHVWIGFFALALTIFLFADKIFLHAMDPGKHCQLGKTAALLAAVALVVGLLMLSGLAPSQTASTSSANGTQELTSSNLSEVEAVEYRGTKLLPLKSQGNNAIAGTHRINKETFRLVVTGLTERELNLSYNQILELPAYSELVYMPCVEGWGFYARWTGFRVTDLLNLTGLKPGAGMFFSLLLMATPHRCLWSIFRRTIFSWLGINNVTLPQDRSFPLNWWPKTSTDTSGPNG